MNDLHPPMSRKDAIAYGLLARVVLLIPTDSDLWAFIEEDVREDEACSDCVVRLLSERLELSKQGF